MNTLTKLNDLILELKQKSNSFFDCFESIYVFGSSINEKSRPNDIDLLFVYSVYCSDIVSNMEYISCKLEEELHIPIHLTVLSNEELQKTNFLYRIKSYEKLI